MNPKARITYRFEPAKNDGGTGGRNAGRMVRISPGGEAFPEGRGSAADSAWPEELAFETDVIPWRSPFQDDPDALERLIRETDGQTTEEREGGKPRGGGDESGNDAGECDAAGHGDGKGNDGTARPSGLTGRISPVPGRAADPGPARPEIGPRAAAGEGTGRSPLDAVEGLPPVHPADDTFAGRIATRRRTPAQSWVRVAATVIGAVLTGALFGWLVMSLLFWQPGSQEPAEAVARPEEPADPAIPAGRPDAADGERPGDLPDAAGGPAVAEVPGVRYHVLQYGVFSTEAGLEEALAQLRAAGHAAAADTGDGYRAYAGIADSRETAEALAASFGPVELYIRPLEIPAAGPDVLAGLPQTVPVFLLRTDELIRMAGGLSATLLAAGGTQPVPEEAWSDWEASHRIWLRAAGALPDDVSADGGMDDIVAAVGKAAEAFAVYRGNPSPDHLRAVQSALIEAAVARRDWLRVSGAL